MEILQLERDGAVPRGAEVLGAGEWSHIEMGRQAFAGETVRHAYRFRDTGDRVRHLEEVDYPRVEGDRTVGIWTLVWDSTERRQLEASAEIRAPMVERHTGRYGDAAGRQQAIEAERLAEAAPWTGEEEA